MIRVLHTGDIHLGDLSGPTSNGENLRRLDTLRCMDHIVQAARKGGPHVTIIAGDLFNRSRVWADTALDDVNDALERFIRPLCEYSDQVVLLFGTMNHDNPRAFEVIKKATGDLPNLHIYTTPKVESLETSAGSVDIVAVPGFDKARLRLFCPGVDKETENRNATALINDVVLGLCTGLDRAAPSILVSHYTVSGSEADNGSTFLAGQDVVILPSTIDACNIDLACFGHIHKPQKLVSTTPAYYCGSPNQLTFNDEGTDHGFWWHEIDTERRGQITSAFENTPERRHLTIRMNEQEVAAFIATGEYTASEEAKDAIIRVRYTCTAEQDKAFNRAELQKQLMAAGAFWVAEITPEDIETLDAKDQLTEHDGPEECLRRWLEANDITGKQADALVELAVPIIKKADDGRDAGKHTGAFTPRTIEVKNYRSYTDAYFDFEPVHMAMVNGQNGVGKSSLFMDAIADCLYEQTRKEDIGGWVRDGTKSGAITFTFGLGGQEYRVIRTRTKSGRGTLALQRLNAEAGVWEDESDTTMKLTQEKIVRLLGMDCNTFCSIALIRQDAYGLFLDADSDRRMEVLSALLGLDIYTRMEEIARQAATEQRRKIAATKERINVLREQTNEKDDLEYEDERLARKIEELEATVREAEDELKALEGADALRQELIKQVEDKNRQIATLKQERGRKLLAAETAERQLADAMTMAEGLTAAQEAAVKLEAARRRVDELAPKKERDKELWREEQTARTDISDASVLLNTAEGNMARYASILERKGEVEAAQAALKDIDARMEATRHKVSEYEDACEARRKAVDDLAAYEADSRVQLCDLEARLRASSGEAEKLVDSGCPSPDSATCKFLASAVKAKQEMPGLEAAIAARKEETERRLAELDKAVKLALEVEEAFGDPKAELQDIEAERKRLQAIADMAPEIATATAKMEEAAAAKAEAQKVASTASANIERIKGERLGLAPALDEYDTLLRSMPELKALADRLPACQAARATADTLRPQIESLRAEYATMGDKRLALEQEIEEIKARIPTENTTISGLRAVVATNRRSLTDFATTRGGIKAKLETIAEVEKQIGCLRCEVEETALVLNDYTTLAQAFGIDGIQYMIIRGVVPEIMRQSNDILAAMTGGRMAVDIRTEKEQRSTKQIVNSLEVWINTITGGTRPYQSHSGGEKVKIALAVTLGLADVKARRAGVQLGMLFIDEPPFLDGDGTEAYADALVSMATRNPNMRILAISHDPTMKARFSQNIIVSAGEDGSTVAME